MTVTLELISGVSFGIQVITKWGLEANDPLLRNAVEN